MPFCCPRGVQIFTHVQGAGHGSPSQLAREAVRERSAVNFPNIARNADVITGDRSREIARNQIPLVCSPKSIPLLSHMERVIARARSISDLHIPCAAEIGS